VQWKIDSEPAFRWWVPHVLNERKRVISAVKTRYLKRNKKFGIEIPWKKPSELIKRPAPPIGLMQLKRKCETIELPSNFWNLVKRVHQAILSSNAT
jgi:hypothetical protein